jgi:hypothetical protein
MTDAELEANARVPAGKRAELLAEHDRLRIAHDRDYV